MSKGHHTGTGHPPEDEPRGAPDPGETDPGVGPEVDGDADGRVAEGVEHLQVAAREMIAAARTFLDVVEEVAGDNAAVASLADALGSLGQVVSRAAARAAGDDEHDAGGRDGDERSGRSRVQHIDVS